MGKDSGSTTTTTQTNDPWSGAQPYIKDVLSQAQNTYNSGQGFSYPDFSTTIPFADQTLSALQGTQDQAQSGNPLGAASQNSALGILGNNGLTPQQQQAAGYAQPYASGANVNGGSPEFNAALDTQAAKLGTDVQRNVDAMGRTGSAYNTNELTQQIGDFRNNAMSQELQREQGLQMQGIGSLANIGQAGAGNQATMASLAPSIYQQQYAPYQQLGNVGSAYQDLATRQMQENIDRYNTNQQSDWQRLGAYNGLINGAGGMGGTQTSSVPAPSPLQGGLSGAMSGAMLGNMLFPGVGAIGGGLLGGLAGLL